MEKPIIRVNESFGELDWESIKNQIDQAVICIGYRWNDKEIMIDESWHTHDEECFRLEIPRQYYIMVDDVTISDAAQSAIWACYQLRYYKDIPIQLWIGDYMNYSGEIPKTKRTDILLSLIDFIHTLYPVWGLGLYLENAFLKFYDKVMLRESNIPLWIKSYHKEPSLPCYLWEYSNNGSLKGSVRPFCLSRYGDKVTTII